MKCSNKFEAAYAIFNFFTVGSLGGMKNLTWRKNGARI